MLDFAKYKVQWCKIFANMMNGKTFVKTIRYDYGSYLTATFVITDKKPVMKHFVLTALVCLVAFSFSACKKSKSKSRTDLITESSWKYQDAGLDVNRDGTVDAPIPAGFMQSCDTDNTITFKSDGTGIADEGATKCNAASPQSSPFTWSFKDNEQTITLSNAVFGGLNGDIKVKTINENQLELHKEVNMTAIVNVIVFLKH
jgi:hypothetical protein